MRESQSKKIKVERYDGMSAVRLTGKRMLPGWCRRAAWSIAHGQHNNELVKDEGAYGGDRAVLQRDTGHPSPLNANYGLCNGPGVDQDGNTISNLCSYSKQDSTEGAESVRHMGTDLHRLARTVFAAAKKAGVLSPATLEQGEFTAVQVRDYDGDNKAYTNLHTDTRVEVDADGKPARQIDQAHPRRSPTHSIAPTSYLTSCPCIADREHRRRNLLFGRSDASVAQRIPRQREGLAASGSAARRGKPVCVANGPRDRRLDIQARGVLAA